MWKVIILSVFVSLSLPVMAATELHDSDMAKMKEKIGNASVSVRNGTFSEAISALSKKADKQHASYFLVTSINRAGMGSNVSATAELYK